MCPPSSSNRRRGTQQASSHRKRKRSGVGDGMCCTLTLNSLWSIWYCSLIVALQLYIVAKSIKSFGQYISLPWPIDDQPYLELNAYVGFLGAAIVLMPFFIATAVLRIGNYPNDGFKVSTLSSTSKSNDHAVYQNVQALGKDVKWSRALWKHLGPTAAFLHVASAFCLLLPKIFIQAQLVRHGFVKKSELWTSELDFMASHSERLVSLSLLSTVNVSELLAHEHSNSKADHFTNHQQQFTENTAAISGEFVNFGISLFVYAISYPSVFWDCNKPFGLLFSIQLFLNGMQQLLAIAAFGILYKVHAYGSATALVRFSPLMLDLTTTVMLFLLYNITISATSCALYAYGLQKHREWIERQLQRHRITWGRERWRLWGYTPHASAFVILVVLASAAAPIIYDLALVYCSSLDGVILATVISTVVHPLLWILLWLFLTIKQRWSFGHKSSSFKKVQRYCPDSRKPTLNGHVPRETADAEFPKLREEKGDAPLLVIDSGHTYQIREKSCRRAILNLASQSMSRQKNSSSTDEEDIYWLKPRLSSSKTVADTANDEGARSSTWIRNQKRSSTSPKSHKVTFEEKLLTSTKKRKPLKLPKHRAVKTKIGNLKVEDFSETGSEDGDYATLTSMAKTHKENQGIEILCPLGEFRMGAMERNDHVEGAFHRPLVPYAEAGSSQTTSSGAESINRTRCKNIPGTFNFSSSEKRPGSACSSGIHSGDLSSVSSSVERSPYSAVTVFSDKSALPCSNLTISSCEAASLPSDSAEPIVSIERETTMRNQSFGGITNRRLTTFAEIPSSAEMFFQRRVGRIQ